MHLLISSLTILVLGQFGGDFCAASNVIYSLYDPVCGCSKSTETKDDKSVTNEDLSKLSQIIAVVSHQDITNTVFLIVKTKFHRHLHDHRLFVETQEPHDTSESNSKTEKWSIKNRTVEHQTRTMPCSHRRPFNSVLPTDNIS